MIEQLIKSKRYMTLETGQVAAFCATGPAHLACVAGRLWVTHDAIPGDHILRPGQSLLMPEGGVALVSGTADAALEYAGLRPAARCSTAARIGNRLGRLAGWMAALAGAQRSTTHA